MPKLTLQAHWEEYWSKVPHPPEHAPEFEAVFRRFFYAGALASLICATSTDDILKNVLELKREIGSQLKGMLDANPR